MDAPEIPNVDGRLAQAVSHPLRVRFLCLLAKRRSLTPDEALQEIRAPGEETALSEVGYHVRVLERFGVIEAASRTTREHGTCFRATDKGERLMLAIGATPGKT